MTKLIKIFLSVLLALTVQPSRSANTEGNAGAAYNKGIELYEKNEYRAAAAEFSKAAEDVKSPEIYYNLGNCYYRLNEYPQARLAWERALGIDPSYSDARYNLSIVVAKLKYSGAQPQSFIYSWAHHFVYSRNTASWTKYAFIAFVLMLVFFLVYYFGGRLTVRKAAFSLSALSALCFALSLTCSIVRTADGDKPTEAIVLSPGDVRQSPSPNSKTLTRIQPGAKIRLTDDGSVRGWRQIRLEGDQKGWISDSAIGLI